MSGDATDRDLGTTGSGATAFGADAVHDGAQLVRRRGPDDGSADVPTDTAGSVHGGAHVAGFGDADAREGNARQRAAIEAEKYTDPKVGPMDLNDLPGPFTPRQLARIDEALSLATEETGLLFSLYVGDLTTPTREAAETLADRLPAVTDDGAVLVAVSPGQRVLHIVTTQGASRRLPNRVCALAALGMRASFVGGDLTAGAVNGLRMLADAAGSHTGRHLPPPAPLGK